MSEHSTSVPTPEPDPRDEAGIVDGPPATTPDGITPAAAADPYEGALPPGYDWPTHGGYLGCLVGVLAAFLIGGFLGANLFSALWAKNLLPGPLFALLVLVAYVVSIAVLGRAGYVLGKLLYRAYPQPESHRRWGEDPSVVAAAAPPAPEPASPASRRARVGEGLGGIVGLTLWAIIAVRLFSALDVAAGSPDPLTEATIVLTYVVLIFVAYLACWFGARALGRTLARAGGGRRTALSAPAATATADRPAQTEPARESPGH